MPPLRPGPRTGPRRLLGLLLIASLAAACSPADDPSPIRTDGRFEDWDQVAAVLTDPVDAPGDAAIDLGAIRLTDDPWWLFFDIELGRPVTVQSMRGALHVLLDADGDPATGARLFDMSGVDLVIELSRQDEARPNGYGGGNGLRPVSAAGPGAIVSGYDLGLLVAPTYAAARVEMRVGRRAGGGLPPVARGARVRVKLVFEGPDGVADQTDVGEYALAHAAAETPEPRFDGDIAKADGTFRVVQWNVSGQNMWDEGDKVRRVLAALDPDVLVLDEATAASTPASVRRFLGEGPLGGKGEWQVVVGLGGGRQHGVVASRQPMRASPELLTVAYASSTLDELAGRMGAAAAATLVPVERASGLATAGAWVEVGGREILFVPVDFQSGGYAGSPEDQLRAVQATAIRDRVDEALRSVENPAVVIAGDLNLVGTAEPLSRLRSGLGRGGTPLAVSPAYRLADRSQATWRSTRYPAFTPGRLDFMLYSGAVLAVDRAFPFDPEGVTPARLAALGLEEGDARAVSDHLPVVTDFRVRGAGQ
ncbi:MAG: endonuclease/exonuclease/phosphatase family protein [Vicinamibacterales bacterium]